jgi:hypothetical protein
VNIAPFDVRQGNFVGAAVNTVTKLGHQRFSGSLYYNTRNQDSRSNAGPARSTPARSTSARSASASAARSSRTSSSSSSATRRRASPRRASSFRANTGGETPAGNVTRVLRATSISRTLPDTNFGYDPGPIRATTRRRRALPDGQARLQPERQQQVQPPLHAPGLRDRRAGLQSSSLGFGGRAQHQQHELPERLQLHDPREHPLHRGGVELARSRGPDVQPDDRRVHRAGRAAAAGLGLPARGHPRRQQHQPTRRSAPSRSRRTTSCATTASSCRTTSRSTAKARPDLRPELRALQVGERVLPGFAERVRVQLAGGLLHRCQRLPERLRHRRGCARAARTRR